MSDEIYTTDTALRILRMGYLAKWLKECWTILTYFIVAVMGYTTGYLELTAGLSVVDNTSFWSMISFGVFAYGALCAWHALLRYLEYRGELKYIK